MGFRQLAAKQFKAGFVQPFQEGLLWYSTPPPWGTPVRPTGGRGGGFAPLRRDAFRVYNLGSVG